MPFTSAIQKGFTYTIEYVIISLIVREFDVYASHVPSQSLTESMHRRLRVQQISKKDDTPRQSVLSK